MAIVIIEVIALNEPIKGEKPQVLQLISSGKYTKINPTFDQWFRLSNQVILLILRSLRL